MRIKIVFLLVLGSVLALASGIGSYRYIRALEAELSDARATVRSFGATVTVPVLSRDAARGSTIVASDVSTVTLPMASVPENVMVELPPPGDGERLIVLGDLKAGQLLLKTDLAKSGASQDFGFILSKDARAFAIAPRNLDDFRDRLSVGDLVDVFWTRDIGGGTTETRLIGSAMRVLYMPNQAPLPAPGAVAGPLDDKMILEGMARDAALAVQAQQQGFFHVMPTANRLDPAAAEVVVGPQDLADLPLVVRAGADLAATNDALSIVSRITTPGSGRTCSTVIVRAASRSVVEVPC